MARYISLSKAARLVGVKRGTLQKRIRAGELSTFEGELDVDELLRVYPETEMEDNTMIERVERFMEEAFAKAMRHEAEALDLHTLAKRVSLLGQELAAAKSEISRYTELLDQIKHRVAGLEKGGDVDVFKSWFVQALEGEPEGPQYPRELLDKETFLRILAAHVRVTPSGHDYFVEGSADLLDAGLSAGLALQYGCSDGSCGRCRARLVSGEVRQTRVPRYPLTDRQRGRGELLLCCHTAVTDVVVEAAERKAGEEVPEQRLTTRVRRVRQLDGIGVIELAMPPEQRLEFRSGQYVRLATEAGELGEYSLASCPCDNTKLEFHCQDGVPLEHGDSVQVRGPKGDFVLGEDVSRPLLLIAVDTGFAPVKGLIEHALALDLVDAIDLVRLGTGPGGHYLDNLCRSWADALDTLQYHPVDAGNADPATALMEALQSAAIDPAASSVYVAAPSSQLAVLREALLGAGVPAEQLHLEPVRQGAPVKAD